MFASADSRNCQIAQDSRSSGAQDSAAIADRTGRLFCEEWQDEAGDEVTTPRLSLPGFDVPWGADMSGWPNGLAGMVVHYGTGVAHTEPLEPFVPVEPLLPAPLPLTDPEDIKRFLTAPSTDGETALEKAAAALQKAAKAERDTAERLATARKRVATIEHEHRNALGILETAKRELAEAVATDRGGAQ